MTLEDYAALVKAMRDCQKHAAANPSPRSAAEARRYERDVDEATEAALHGKQRSLFGAGGRQ